MENEYCITFYKSEDEELYHGHAVAEHPFEAAIKVAFDAVSKEGLIVSAAPFRAVVVGTLPEGVDKLLDMTLYLKNMVERSADSDWSASDTPAVDPADRPSLH